MEFNTQIQTREIIYSFDVFDTCLIRVCGEPVIVFHLVAHELYGHNTDDTLIFDFVNSRLKAEKNAIKNITQKNKEDISLEEIYNEIDSVYLQSFGLNNLIKLELRIEEEVLRPNTTIKNQIDELRKNGNNIVFISDMYLPSDFILKQLKRFDFWKTDDLLFVSNEIGLTKRSGSLFDYISTVLNVEFKNWNHYGDNFRSDFSVPKSKGIKPTLIKNVE